MVHHSGFEGSKCQSQAVDSKRVIHLIENNNINQQKNRYVLS